MNVLFLTLSNFNSIADQGIYTDLLRQFRDNGHNVYVVSPREKRYNLATDYNNESGVNILRVRIGNITKTNILEKGLSTIRIETQFLREIKKHLSNVKFDLVMYSTPPITFAKVVDYIRKRDNSKSYLLLKDIFPQNAVDLQMFSKGSLIYWYFRKKEKRLYRLSDYIGCMSQANIEYMLANNPGIMKDKIEVCPNSIEPVTFTKHEDKAREIRAKYNIPDYKTIFIYGGNLGKPQGVDFLIECIESNQANRQVFFLIVGSGTEFDRLKSYIDNEKPENVQLISQIPKNEYDKLANSCDVGLIFLDPRFTIPNFPSRLLSYMQASMPVLAATDSNTDIGKVIEEGEFGFWCESRDVNAFNENVQLLCDPELRKQKGINARAYLENHYTAKHSYEIIMQHFQGEK